MTDKKKRAAADFGRDELNALLGGGLSEMVASFRPAAAAGMSNKNRGASANKSKKDVADMTVQETAAMILREQTIKAQKVAAGTAAAGRLRAVDTSNKRRRNYQALLDEGEEATAQSAVQQQQIEANSEANEEENEEEFVAVRRPRVKAAPVVVVMGKKRSRERNSNSSEQSDNDNSSSSSRNESTRRRRRHDASSSSDSEDSAADRRRARLLQQRRQKQEAVVVNDSKTEMSEKSEVDDAGGNQKGGKPEKPVEDVRTDDKATKPPRKAESSSDEDSSSEDESSFESSSSEEEETAIVKPLFVPKHKRGTVKTVELEAADKETKAQKLKQQEERRKQESRVMVQQIVTAKRDVDEETGIEGITGAMNEIPDDKDDENDVTAREEWQVRELERLLEDWDLEQDRLEGERELARRRNMTDEERMKEDEGMGRQRSGEHRAGQKFYHRGAFYMDESEWDQTDVRHKAAEYAQAATGDDKRDRSQLPKVMQVKRFGFANQSKYKGLAAEDTTDKQMDILPLNRR